MSPRLRLWWPPALRAALHSWQQTCEEQETELSVLRHIRDCSQMVVDGGKGDQGVPGLAESLANYRRWRDGKQPVSVPRIAQSRSAK